ncbi:hypothetical protein JCM8097_000567 [Rhodosporidiobolus ruineniae]
MLSRLKRRTPSSTYDLPTSTDDLSSLDDNANQLPPSPTPSSKNSKNTTTPRKSADTNDGRTLSPTRALGTSARSSRSSSFGSLAPPVDRRTLNASAPGDMGRGTLVPGGPGASGDSGAGGPGNGDGGGGLSLDSIGQGSLTLDHLALPPGHATAPNGAPLTLVVQAPELLSLDAGGVTPTAESADMRTPVPSHHPDFPAANDHRARGMSSSSGPVAAVPSSSSSLLPTSHPRSHTTSEAFLSRTSSGLDALAAINVPRSRPASPHRSATTSPASTSRPGSRSHSRPASRSSSIISSQHQRPDHLRAPPSYGVPSASGSVSPSRGRKGPSPGGGIAGALALSGVALASPSQTLRQPHGLVRLSSDQGAERIPAAAAGGATSGAASARESIDSNGNGAAGGGGGRTGASSPVDSLEPVVLDGDDALSTYGDSAHGGAFLSMDQLGDFDDVVSQLGTGYAVASSKRNTDFHALFKNISDDDYLIEDYGCALQREILIQGRLYISEHHLSFYANIFGWVTSLTIPFSEVCSIEKRMTAYVIPNAIQVATMHARHTFASFLSRDTTYDLIGNIWRMVHPVVPMSAALPDALTSLSGFDTRSTAAHSHAESDDEGAGAGTDEAAAATATAVEAEHGIQKAKRRLRGFRRPRGGTGESSKPAAAGGASGAGDASAESSSTAKDGAAGAKDKDGGGGGKEKSKMHPPTTDTLPLLKNLKEVCLDTVFPGKPEKIYNLMFTSGFMKDFWAENQKLTEIQISDWAPQASGSNLLARSMSYIKPLNGSIGPKSTKCLITDESAHVDFDDFVCVVTTTRTPDVPSGGSFAVKTRTSMTWAKGNQTRVVVTTGVEWTKSSFIKGIIDKSAIDGQKTYHNDLEAAMRSYISTHRNEFVEEGHDVDSSSLAPSSSEDDDHAPTSPISAPSAAETASKPAPSGPLAPLQSLLEPLLDSLLQQSPKTLLLGAIVAILVLSNLWTLRSSSRDRDASYAQHPLERATRARGETYAPGLGHAPPSSPPGMHGHQSHPHEVASAVRDVLHDYFAAAHGHAPAKAAPVAPAEEAGSAYLGGREDLDELERMLDRVEERVRRLREEVGEARAAEKAAVESGAGGESAQLD